MAYAFPLILMALFALFGDFGERGLVVLMLYAFIVVIYLLACGVWQMWKKQPPPLNKINIACWLITTFFLAQLASTL
ncbi:MULTISPECIES: hypothetical protein [Deefgea]|uniref:Transporter n=1 Tax=Deefgea chitinilytica TaxID=570276 RepID=A0ABS2CGH7_9NEIS|nr:MULTISPECIES: hypothetical protein [Deefgea]MBM5572496.1 hypothetical protein [Deefgea chitinilytica]MBM9889732.1 hypothetical protein [Deefgea sp. CFH1-16]